VALAGLVGMGTLALPAGAAAGVETKRCAALERRLDGRLRRGLKACAKGIGPLGRLACASDKRGQHVATLRERGCAKPAWAVEVEVLRMDADTAALRWTGRLNWARLLDEPRDPIASTVRLADERFENLLLLAAAGDLAAAVDYVEDVEGRAADVVNGLPGGFGGAGGRGRFPGIDDRAAADVAAALPGLLPACDEGAPSMFAERKVGGTSGETFDAARDPNAAGDNGNRGLALAKVVMDIIDAFSDDDEPTTPPADDPPADDEQCTENADGSCTEGGENDDEQQSQEGKDDPEGTPAPAPAPAPASDPGSDEGGCARDLETFVSVCESLEWQSPTCRAFVQFTNGCADEALINPGPEGEAPCSGQGMSDAEYRELQCEARQGIMQPAPDGELVCRTIEPGLPAPGLRLDPCNCPEAQGTEECAEQGGIVGGGLGGEAPPTPRPDPRIGLR
jgi:hypothetical protein